MAISGEIRRELLKYQRAEVTEYHIYRNLAGMVGEGGNRRVLERIADDEMRHAAVWREYTGVEVTPHRWNVVKYTLISRIFGFTFGVKLMEGGEANAQINYEALRNAVPEARSIMREENEHETALLDLLDEERLRYTGSIVLGLNDALVELTGALAGLTLGLRDTKLIALTGSIIGIAAALSMAASEYLSTKSEETAKNPLRASVYTGITYLGTVLALIVPYLVVGNYFLCLGFTLAIALLIIALFNYYIAVVKDEPFRGRFVEMAGLSFGVAGLSFLAGFALRVFFGIEV